MAHADGTKSGGRRAGTPNKIKVATRERIEEGCDPIGFMMRVARGEPVEQQQPDTDKPGEFVIVQILPTVDQQIDANIFPGRKLVPDAKASTIKVQLPEIKTAEDVLTAIGAVAAAVGSGTITPEQGHTIAGLS